MEKVGCNFLFEPFSCFCDCIVCSFEQYTSTYCHPTQQFYAVSTYKYMHLPGGENIS